MKVHTDGNERHRLVRIHESPSWVSSKKRFHYPMRRVDGSILEIGYKFFFQGSKYRTPHRELAPAVDPRSEWNRAPRSGLRVTWLGHSTTLVEIDGIRTLVDPVWARRASPVTWAGPRRFYEPPVALDELPELDAVVISHDHYDHLDRSVVLSLASKGLRWIVPLGVGAHLERWGIAPQHITELDWWEDTRIGDVTLTATPARHFSGRSILFTDQNATLWAGWAWNGPSHSVFYSGDTGLHPDFKTIGERLGPFDVTLMETGAYNPLWADVHMGPEQAVLAHKLVRGRVFMPVHWGLFDLSLHGWTEPAERAIVAAERLNVNCNIIRPGAAFDVADAPSVDRWWPDVPWTSGVDSPVWSTGVSTLQAPLKRPPLYLVKSTDSA